MKFLKLFVFIIIIINLIGISFIIVYPIEITDTDIYIQTPDINNPTEKILTYKVRSFNKLKFSSIDFIVDFYKEEVKDLKHPYYDLIPDQFQGDDVLSIGPRESKEFSFSTNIKTNDERIINSSYNAVKAKYEIMKREIRGK